MSKTIPWSFALVAAMSFAPAHAATAPSVTLQQCANGSFAAARACSGAAWTSGTVNKKNSHYAEDQATPLRILIGGLTVGSSGNMITFQWDTTEAGVHAYDYLESFDHTETLSMGDDPCSGVAGCNLGTFTTFPVPVDTLVTDGGVTPRAGIFVLFGGTITGVSAYQYVGTYTGRSSAAISITFTANTPNPVLAMGGHLASASDWGSAGSGASSVSGTLQARLYSFNGKNKSQTQSLSGVALIPGP